jgi:hypothetical protein
MEKLNKSIPTREHIAFHERRRAKGVHYAEICGGNAHVSTVGALVCDYCK